MKTTPCLLAISVLFACSQHVFATEPDLSKLAAANNDFAFDLLKQLSAEQSNKSIFISPYSAATALEMVASGAASQTKSEMQKVLGTAQFSPGSLNDAVKAAADLIHSGNTNLILTTANGLWYRQGATMRPDFIAAARNYFGATVEPLDFNNAAAAEAKIDQWGSEQTHGRIQGIADGMIDPSTDLILANAIYFKGKWADPFDVRLTKDRPFHPAVGAAKNLPMMEMSTTFSYRKGTGYQAVKLPYMGYDLAMYVFLPDPGSSPEKLLQTMNGDRWRRVTIPGFNDHEGKVVLPRFKLDYVAELNQPLEAKGMKTVFDANKADFSGSFSDRHFISEIRQQAFVEVKEEGTEAAAVTVIGVSASGIELNPPPRFEMILDRPFLFAIVDARSGMILFMGVVNEL